MRRTLVVLLSLVLLISNCSIPETPDELVPVVVVLYPTSGQTVTGEVTINIAAGDDGDVKDVDLYINDLKVKHWTGQKSTYSYVWNTNGLEENSIHYISAVAHDKEDNLGFSGSVIVTVFSGVTSDNTPPTIDIVYPIEGQQILDTMNVLILAEDNTNISKVDLYINGIVKSTLTSVPFSTEIDLSDELNGSSHTLVAIAYDESNNFTASSPVTISKTETIYDNISPSTSIIYPPNNASLDDIVNIMVQANDNIGIHSVYLYDNGQLVGVPDDAYPYEFQWDIQQFPYGSTHDLFIKAVDVNGNEGFSSIVRVTREESVYTPPDVTPPVVTVLAPVDGVSLSENTDIIVDVIDDSEIDYVEFYINGNMMLIDETLPYLYNLDISSFEPGSQHSLYVKAYDQYENVGTAYQVLVIQ